MMPTPVIDVSHNCQVQRKSDNALHDRSNAHSTLAADKVQHTIKAAPVWRWDAVKFT
jgi:hypothetical protein